MNTQYPDLAGLLRNPAAFARQDDTDDAAFYAVERKLRHLDTHALATVERLVGSLVVEEAPDILDLMASFDTHLPNGMAIRSVVGLGLNESELAANLDLTDRVIHDLNRNPVLPFEDDTFDVVLNVVSIPYLTRPFDLFAEVARVLRPGGLFLVVFSNRAFPSKEIQVWSQLREHERLDLVSAYFEETDAFGPSERWISIGAPRPSDDRHAGLGLPSDPVYAVWADTTGAASDRPVRKPPESTHEKLPPEVLAARIDAIPKTNACPYCEEQLRIWAVTDNDYSTWDTDLLVCINDACPYVVRGWEVMFKQGAPGRTTRFCYNPVSGKRVAVPVPNLSVIKDALR